MPFPLYVKASWDFPLNLKYIKKCSIQHFSFSNICVLNKSISRVFLTFWNCKNLVNIFQLPYSRNSVEFIHSGEVSCIWDRAPCHVPMPEISTATHIHCLWDKARESRSACSHVLSCGGQLFCSCFCIVSYKWRHEHLCVSLQTRERALANIHVCWVCVEKEMRCASVCKCARAPRNSRPTSHIKSRSATDEYPSVWERDRNSNHRLRRIFIYTSLFLCRAAFVNKERRAASSSINPYACMYVGVRWDPPASTSDVFVGK